MEEWRSICGVEGRYEVSNEGRVRRHYHSGPRVITPSLDKYGYHTIRLSRDGVRRAYKVHRLVCEAWNGAPTAEHCAHFDGDKLNNRPENLRWASRSENAFDSMRHGVLKVPPRGPGWPKGKHKNAKGATARLTEQQVEEIRMRRGRGDQGKDVAAEFGVDPATVSRIFRRRAWAFL
jgi:hypothetical protein